MSPPLHAQIRALLRDKDNEDGMSPSQIAEALDAKLSKVHAVLEGMEKIDAYVDRWVPFPCPGGYISMWMVVTPPESAPRPDPRPSRKFPELQRAS